MGVIKLIPLKWHGYVELAVGISIPITPLILEFKEQALYFYVITGLIIFFIGLLSDYDAPSLNEL